MSNSKINIEDFMGVWENQNIVPFAYNDKVEITLFFGSGTGSNITIEETGRIPISYFSDEFEVKEILDDNFKLVFQNSDFDKTKDFVINCRMYIKKEPYSFIANMNKYGERYFERK